MRRRQVHHGHEDAEETQHVDDEHDDFDGGQRTAYKDVDDDAEDEQRPQQHGAVPAFARIRCVCVVEADELQDEVCDEIAH